MSAPQNVIELNNIVGQHLVEEQLIDNLGQAAVVLTLRRLRINHVGSQPDLLAVDPDGVI